MTQEQNRNNVDWIEQLFDSGKASALMRTISDGLDKTYYNTEDELAQIEAATNPIDLMDAVGKYCSTCQFIAFKAGYLIATSIARQSF